jgi:hypothetical protein
MNVNNGQTRQGHAWNEVKFAGDLDQNGMQKTYVVDLMHVPGALYRCALVIHRPNGVPKRRSNAGRKPV